MLFPRALPLLGVMLLAALLSLLLRDFFTQVILVPLWQQLRWFYRLYRALPQNVLWSALVVIAFLIALRAVLHVRQPKASSFEEDAGANRVDQLSRLAESAQTSQHARWELAREIRQVAISLLQLGSSETEAALQRHILTGDLAAPPEVVALFRLCADIPSYRRFMEAREAAPGDTIPQLAALDLDAVVAALAQWQGRDEENA